MYYKVLKEKTVIDVLSSIIYVKYQVKHGIIVICDSKEAEAVLSSDGNYGWHIEGLYNFQPDKYKYEIKEISKYEYNSLIKDDSIGG